MKKRVNYFTGLLLFLSVLSGSTALYADVVTDGTVGAGLSLAGPHYDIPAGLGKVAGGNLFHSFDTFSLTNTQSATFTHTGPGTIANVISRVTGKDPSSIDGLLRSTVGQADFFFINPKGIVFGPNAQVDVPAAFHAGTADEIRFADGTVFSAVSKDAGTLTQAAPESFGFLGPKPASIEINGSLLEFEPGSVVSLSGNGVDMEGTAAQDAELIVESGELRITATGDGAADVPVDTDPAQMKGKGQVALTHARLSTSGDPAGTLFIAAGEISLDRSAVRSTAVDGDGGAIYIKAGGDLSLDNDSDITAFNIGAGNGPKMDIKAGGVLVQGGSMLDSRTSGSGPAGGITLDVDGQVVVSGKSLSNESLIMTGSVGDAAHTGGLLITASNLTVDQEGKIFTGNLGSGKGTDAVINADTLTIAGDSAISSLNSGTGQGGDIIISLTGDMTLTGDNDTMIMSTMGDGQGGDIHITTDGKLIMEGGARIIMGSLNPSQGADSGTGGSLFIDAGEIHFKGGSTIYANSEKGSAGQVGDVDLKADQAVVFEGYDPSGYICSGIDAQLFGSGGMGTIRIEAPVLTLANGAKIQAQNYSTLPGTNGADIEIHVDDLMVTSSSTDFWGYSEIVASAGWDPLKTGSGVGNSGSILINAENSVTIDGNDHPLNAAIRNSSPYGETGNITVIAETLFIGNNSFLRSTTDSGKAGSIVINVDRMAFKGGEISTRVSGKGIGGTITITAGTSVDITGVPDASLAASKISQVDSLTYGEGHAGSVTITTPYLHIGAGGRIATTTDGQGDGGTITISSGRTVLADGGKIYASALQGSQGKTGTVDLTATDMLEMSGTAEISTDSAGQGHGGDITIRAGNILLEDALITTSVAGLTGNGGDILISGIGGSISGTPANALVLKEGFIQANTAADNAVGGNIYINVKAVVIDANTDLLVGGGDRQAFQSVNGVSVIQAAAPNGEKGRVTVTAPELDISGSMADMSAHFATPARLMTDPCLSLGDKTASSLVRGGRGGIPEGPGSPSAVSYAGRRLDRLLEPDSGSR